MIFNETIFGKDENNDLETYAVEHKSQKGKSQHHYTRYYNFYFSPVRYDKLSILEIGVNEGESLRMWKEYFPNSNVYGIDITDERIDQELVDGCEVFIGSQADGSFLKEVCDSVEGVLILL